MCFNSCNKMNIRQMIFNSLFIGTDKKVWVSDMCCILGWNCWNMIMSRWSFIYILAVVRCGWHSPPQNRNYTSGLWRLQRYQERRQELYLFVFSPTSLWCWWRLLSVKTTLSKLRKNSVMSSFAVKHIGNHLGCKPSAHRDRCAPSQWKKLHTNQFP